MLIQAGSFLYATPNLNRSHAPASDAQNLVSLVLYSVVEGIVPQLASAVILDSLLLKCSMLY